MAIQRKRKWLWLSPARLHTFKVRAWSPTAQSDWAGVTLNLSDAPLFEWDATAGLMARPIWFRRSIRVVWTAFPARYRKWFDHYIIFRKDVTPPDAADFAEAALNKEDSEFFIANTFERYSWLGADSNPEDVNFRNKYTAWNHFYFDENIELETTYYYWVHAVNQRGELSEQYLGPDSALWGKPQLPVLHPGWFSTQVHDINKWSCDVLAWWDCRPDSTKPGGAEWYIIQRRQKNKTGNPLLDKIWGEQIRIDHDYQEELDPNKVANEGRYQAGVIHNFWVDRDYEFRIKAVNIPGVGNLGLESGWTQPDIDGNYPTYHTEHDTEPPPEVTGVAANRFYWQGFQRGDYVRLRWDRFWQNDDSGVRAPILTEQVAFWNIYRLRGTDAEATTYADSINVHAGYAQDSTWDGSHDSVETLEKRVAVLDQGGKFEGTQFIDDNVESTAGETEETTVWDFSWDCEGDNDTERATATAGDGTVVASYYLPGGGAIQSSIVHGGSWAVLKNSGGYWDWAVPPADAFANGDEGYASVWVYGPFSLAIGDDWIFRINLNLSNRIQLNVRPGNVFRMERIGNGITHLASTTWPSASTWHQIEMRWSVSGNAMSMRIDGGTWIDADTTTPLSSFAGTPTYVSLNNVSNGYYWDDINLSLTYVPTTVSSSIYYHYWITAVDSYGYESDVTLVDSYDKVSFLPPPNVTGLEDRQELVNNHPAFRMYSLKVLWDIIDEATHYQVRIKVKPPGKILGVERQYGFWHYSALLREERFYDDDSEGKASYTYPLSLVYGTKVTFAVIAWNRAGKSPSWTESAEITMERDDSAPGNVLDFKGDCLGVNNLYTGIQQWNAVNVSFQPRPHSDGVKCYIVEIKNLSSDWEYLDEFSPKLGLDSDRFPSVRVKYTIPARVLPDWVQDRDNIELRIYVVDSDNNTSPNTIPEDPWPETTVSWERWWQF